MERNRNGALPEDGGYQENRSGQEKFGEETENRRFEPWMWSEPAGLVFIWPTLFYAA